MHTTEIIRNFLSPAQLDTVNELIATYDSSNDTVEAPIGRYIGVSSEVNDIINKLVDKLPNEVLFVKVLDAIIPGGPHADTALPNPLPANFVIPNAARTFIIPLHTCNSHTILFHQVLPLQVDTIEYITNSMGYLPEDTHITDVEYEKYLSHINAQWRKKLSIETIFPWIAGDMLIFDRNKIHCSDNYLKNDLTGKRGFVIWSEIQ
jgi:hypothetical protein